jgi:hypothetical protein
MEMNDVGPPVAHKTCQPRRARQIQRMRHAGAKAFEPFRICSAPQGASLWAYERDAVAPLAQSQGEVENLALAPRKTPRRINMQTAKGSPCPRKGLGHMLGPGFALTPAVSPFH